MSQAENQQEVLNLEADVLILGGGAAATWAAWSAAEAGANVILADKGYCGTSGATAAAGNGIWYVQPEAELRETAMQTREGLGGYLAERSWMSRVLEQTYTNVNLLAEWGYPFPLDEHGKPFRQSLRGPEYMKLMRKQIKRAGVRILDHSPVLELLLDQNGAVGGATGINRQTKQPWRIQAGAVVVATGGCAFLSKGLGCNVLTGDGYLLAAETGAELSGMEFSNSYAFSATFATVTKTSPYFWATFYTEDGQEIEGAGSWKGRSVLVEAMLKQQVYASLDKMPMEMRPEKGKANGIFHLPFNRMGIDPYTEKFPITMRLEGTIRGTGGIRMIDETCRSSVQGLYAAGDAATRELICGGFTGGGSHNAAWATSSGTWAGKGAADYARSLGDQAFKRKLAPQGGAGLRPAGEVDHKLNLDVIIKQVQDEVFPYDKNFFRSEAVLAASLEKLDRLWQTVRQGLLTDNSELVRAREVSSMIATARWMYASAQQRKESRGMHKRLDYQEQDANQNYRLLTGGTDEVWVKPEQKSLVSAGEFH